MNLTIHEKTFIFEVFLKKHKLYDRYLAYQRKHYNRGIREVVKESNFFNLLSGTILWGLEIEDFMELNHLHLDDDDYLIWAMCAEIWSNFVTKLVNG